jgi:hypothetical protein
VVGPEHVVEILDVERREAAVEGNGVGKVASVISY